MVKCTAIMSTSICDRPSESPIERVPKIKCKTYFQARYPAFCLPATINYNQPEGPLEN